MQGLVSHLPLACPSQRLCGPHRSLHGGQRPAVRPTPEQRAAPSGWTCWCWGPGVQQGPPPTTTGPHPALPCGMTLEGHWSARWTGPSHRLAWSAGPAWDLQPHSYVNWTRHHIPELGGLGPGNLGSPGPLSWLGLSCLASNCCWSPVPGGQVLAAQNLARHLPTGLWPLTLTHRNAS